MQPWEHVVEIPEGKVGEYMIRHIFRDAGKVARSNLRTAMFGGQGDKPLEFDRKTQWHELSYDGGVWMTDLPIEQQQHDNELEPVCGRVVVGGLGVGYAANVLAARSSVDEVVVVEISKEVVELVGPHVKDPHGKLTIVTADLFDYLKQEAEDDDSYFDWGFYDIWQSDGEGTFHETVVPLRKISEGWVDNVVCWNENVMRGQLCQSLHSRWGGLQILRNRPEFPEGTDPKVIEGAQGHFEVWERMVGSLDQLCEEEDKKLSGAIFKNWSVPFWKAVKAGVVTDENFRKLSGAYAGTYGHEGWYFWWTQHVMKGGEV